MIQIKDKKFILENEQFTYIMKVSDQGHLLQLYFGEHVSDDVEELRFHFEQGSSTSYNDQKPYSLGNLLLEIPTFGKGDYREPSLHVKDVDSILDLKYKSHVIVQGKEMNQPAFNEECETLIITLVDEVKWLEVELEYNLYETVLTRSVRVKNASTSKIEIKKVMSMNLDFCDSDYELLTLNGAWIRERHVHLRKLFGTTRIDSKKGVSSADHNPFFALTRTGEEHYGDTYGFGLVYSGNFEMTAEVNSHDLLRVQMGINTFDFSWTLESGEAFKSPEVVLTYSKDGLNGMSKNFHEAIQKKFLRGQWKNKLRPVKVNNWEATYFDFNEKKLLKIAKEAKDLGIELFVLDDGWFGKRDDDTTSLGDYTVYKKKIKSIPKLAEKINKMGLMFGIWVEPEMISIDSDLYRAHPEWAIRTTREPSLGRNQLVLDMSNPEVIDYLYTELSSLFAESNIEYVKWDMNRNFSDVFSDLLDNLGEFYHRYVLGLYELLERLTKEFPHILFESCSSGGNRFDLGMLYYMPQTWVSDNTDPVTRKEIQYGTSMIYPLSTMANHVSASPNHQTFRTSPIETRFNVACFGVLGYELDLTTLTSVEKKIIKKQIAWYKENREVLQFGEFNRIKKTEDELVWSVGTNEQVLAHYQGLNQPNPGYQKLQTPFVEDGSYHVKMRDQFIDVRTFGSHINQVLPVKIKPNGVLHTIISNKYLFKLEEVERTLKGNTIRNYGIDVLQRFTGTGYNENVRLNEDFASRLYKIKEINNE